MIQFNIVAEDSILVAERGTITWGVSLSDIHKCRSHHFTLEDTELAAIVCLMVAGDEWEGRESVRDGLYEIATAALESKHIEKDIWPIP